MVHRSKLRPFYVVAAGVILLAIVRVSVAQISGDADLNGAYKALSAKDYDRAVALFRKGLTGQPGKAAAHKDLAYTLLKTGENEEARDEFEKALKLDPKDETAALEFAFLAYETKKPQEARRTFDQLRHGGNPQTRATAQTAFENIDRPLAEGIARWQEALKRAANPNDLSFYSAHWELAQWAELRDDFALAAEHYEVCRKLKPQFSELLLIEARVWKHLNRLEDANAALLAGSRSTDSRTAELAREQLGSRYPYPYEFLAALKLDERNIALRTELAYLYLAMHKDAEAKAEFERVLQIAPGDHLATEQLNAINGFKTRPPADTSKPAAKATQPPVDAKTMGKKSLDLGYTNDAIKYLLLAHEQDPEDPEISLKLGYAYNLAKNDTEAISWFDRARHSDNPFISVDAAKAFHNLRGDPSPQTTVWLLPMYSTRWHDGFTYGQVKRTIPLPLLPRMLSFYVSNRFDGDLKGRIDTAFGPGYLSESAFILAGGLSTRTWHHFTGWAEAGEALKYLPNRRDQATPDYRGGVFYNKGFGYLLNSPKSGSFYEMTADATYVHRFDKDLLFHSSNQGGRTFHIGESFSGQLLLNANFAADAKSQYWTNFVEFGPGLRLHMPWMPNNSYFSGDFMRGVYTKGPYLDSTFHNHYNFNDARLGFWYAVTK